METIDRTRKSTASISRRSRYENIFYNYFPFVLSDAKLLKTSLYKNYTGTFGLDIGIDRPFTNNTFVVDSPPRLDNCTIKPSVVPKCFLSRHGTKPKAEGLALKYFLSLMPANVLLFPSRVPTMPISHNRITVFRFHLPRGSLRTRKPRPDR